MNVNDATEVAYKNGYAKGYKDAIQDVRNELDGMANINYSRIDDILKEMAGAE